MSATWTCSEGHVNDVSYRVCDLCGAERARRRSEPKPTLAVYREPPPIRWRRRIEPHERCADLPADERCEIPGCTKTYAEHKAEALRAIAGLDERNGGRR